MKSILKKAAALVVSAAVAVCAADGAAVYAASAVDARAYISTLNGYLDTLYVKMRKCKRAGIATDYEQVTYSVIERWAKKYLSEDIENGWLGFFDSYTRPELDRMFNEANSNLQAYLDGTKTAFSVPRYVSSDMETDGYTVTAETKDSLGNISRRPVFFTGFGHFEDAAADIPKFQSFGMNTIQNEIGPDSVIFDNMAWNVSCIGGADASAELCKTERYSGVYSLKIQNKTPKSSRVYLDVSQSVKLRTNTAYTLSLWVKAENISSFQVSYNGGQSRFLIDDGTYDWKKFSFDFTTGSTSGSGQVWILAEDISDAVFVDDIELCERGSAENLVQNGDFEDYVPSADGKYYVYEKGADAAAKMLESAEQNDIAVSLLLSPHYFPNFLLDKYPEICGENGKFIPHSEKALEILSAYIAAVVPKIKDYKSLNNICLTNEPSFCPAEYGEFYKLQWMAFLKEKYGGRIENANSAYGTAYTDWSEIEMQKTYDQTALGYDNRVFARQLFADWHKYLANTVHFYAPEVPIHAKTMGYIGTHELFDTKLNTNADIEYFDDFSDITGCDYSIEWSGIAAGIHKPLAESLWYDYMAGVGGKPVINSEDHMYVDGEENFTSEQRAWMRTNVWQGAVHHRSFSQIWTWRKDYNPKSIYYGSMLFRPDCIEEIGRTNLDLNRLSYEVAALANSEEDTAILYSSASRQYSKSHMYSVYNAYEASLFSGKKVRIVTEDRLDGLRGCRVLILADCPNVPQSTADAICEFIDGGGKAVIVGAMPCTADENNAVRTDGSAEKICAAAEIMSDKVNLAEQFGKYYNKNGMQKVLITDADTGGQTENIEWTYAEYGGGMLVNVCNYDMNTEKNIRISVDGKAVSAAKELRSGSDTGEIVSLEPYKPILIYISGERTEEADNIRLEPSVDGQLRLSWDTNDENTVGVAVYGYSKDGGMTKIISSEEKSFVFDKPDGINSYIVKTYNRAGVESYGKTAAYSEERLFSVECTAEKSENSVKCSISAAAETAAAGTVIAVLKDGDGNLLNSATVGKITDGTATEHFEIVFRGNCENAKTAEVFVSGSADGKNEISNRVKTEL